VPELPDIEVYLSALRSRIVDHELVRIRIANPFLLRSFDPPLADAEGRRVSALRRLGKRIVLALDADYFLVLHLMVAGRLHWRGKGVTLRGKQQLAAFDFVHGSLLLTEAGTKKRASLYLVRGEPALSEHDPGGIEPLECSRETFGRQLLAENRTLKRALTNPGFFSGIGNAYSDEILHAAGLSPVQLTSRLSDDEVTRLFEATVNVLIRWRDRLMQAAGDAFPDKVTAFRDGMAVHGRFGEPCPACGTTVARIRYKNNETNYCPACQTGGRILADRSLSRLLKDDWPDRL
jgi:formamidopyrimidine-DNA glycosylase